MTQKPKLWVVEAGGVLVTGGTAHHDHHHGGHGHLKFRRRISGAGGRAWRKWGIVRPGVESPKGGNRQITHTATQITHTKKCFVSPKHQIYKSYSCRIYELGAQS
jgi:hypothetical protein